MLTTGQAHLRSADNPNNLTEAGLDLASGFGWAVSAYSNSNGLEPQGEHIGWFKVEKDGRMAYLPRQEQSLCLRAKGHEGQQCLHPNYREHPV